MKAAGKYTEQHIEIQNQLLVLKDKLQNHKTSFEENSLNWSYIGDLGYVLTQLKEINSFLK